MTVVKLNFIDMYTINHDIKASMIIGKMRHRFIHVNVNYIYSVGGRQSGNKYLNDCEIYDIRKDKWELGPKLNEIKMSVSGCYLNEIVYVFGGSKGTTNISSIETLKVQNGPSKWNFLKISNNTKIGKSDMGCFPLSETQILLFGGIQESIGCTDENYLLDLLKSSIEVRPAKLCKKEWFISNAIYAKGKKIYISGALKLNLNVYDMNTMTWNIITFKEWNKSK